LSVRAAPRYRLSSVLKARLLIYNKKEKNKKKFGRPPLTKTAEVTKRYI